MDAGEDQNTGSANGNPQASGNSRAPQIARMSLYERQAVQALQALQRQPNAAQYFQQLMLQQQINTAQLQNFAVQQVATILTIVLHNNMVPSSTTYQL
uniref:Polyhomeotic homolog 1 n=1 Tax=Fundulus heteroclitus TaxID=8078 RepID=A0A3Q2QPT9_FUNHE